MLNATSIFGQVLALFPRPLFQQRVTQCGAERGAKGFSSWDQFVAMLFCQLADAASLREICAGLAAAGAKLGHIGLSRPPARATLAYANARRPAELFEAVFHDLLGRAGDLVQVPRHRFRFKNPLYSIDSTTIDLCLSLFPWADFRRTKGGVKLHTVLDHEGHLPVYALITNARQSEMAFARELFFPPGSVLVFDRGYNDYAWYDALCASGVFFVTRLKERATYVVIESRPAKGLIRSDETIRLVGRTARKCRRTLRRVVFWDEAAQRELVFLTNQLEFSAATIAAIYKDRWQIELFFKALKQNLRVKSFVGTTRNALLTQIWTALIALLLLKILQMRSRKGWALSTLCNLMRWNLFAYRELHAWLLNLDNPPPEQPPPLYQAGLGQLVFQ